MLSVIIPTFNNEKVLPLSIASALAVEKVSEIIVVDDHSTDNTIDLLKKLSLNSKKLKFLRNKKNLGTGLTFINGLYEASNEYIIMLNSDDFFIPKGINNLLDYLISNALEVCYGKMGIKKINKIFKYSHPGYTGKSYVNNRNELKQLLIHDMYLPSFGTIMKRDILLSFYNKEYYKNLLQEYGDYFKAHDYDLFINLAKQKKKFGFLNETVCIWCPKENSQSGEDYFKSGQAYFESIFLFNRYSDMEKFSHHEIELIERRVLNKLMKINHDKSFANMKILNHVNEFKKRIKRLKIGEKKTKLFNISQRSLLR